MNLPDSISSQVDRILLAASHKTGVNSSNDGYKLLSELSLTSDLGFDSLDTVELVAALEEHFEIEIPDTVFKVSTVAQLREFVSSLVLAQRKT